MCNARDVDDSLRIVNAVQDAVMPDTNPPKAFIAMELLTARRPRFSGNPRILSHTRCTTSAGKSFNSFFAEAAIVT
jgi:hypothetical protein